MTGIAATVFITRSCCSHFGAASNKQGKRFRLAAVEGQLQHRFSVVSYAAEI